MNGPAREEIDAKLEALGTRTDARIAALDGRIDVLVAKFDAFEKRIEQRFDHFEKRWDERLAEMDKRWDERFEAMDQRYGAIFASIDRRFLNLERDIRNLKNTVIVTAISATLATVFGVGTFNATVLNNMVQSFESGKDTSAAQAEIRRQQGEIERHVIELEKNTLRMNRLLDQGAQRRQDRIPPVRK